MSTASIVEAQVARAFTPRFTATMTGDIVFIGNTIMTCSSDTVTPGVLNPANCAAAQSGALPKWNNNFTMVHVDDDGDITTFNSSSATLTLPPGATVRFAGLYWGADSTKGGGSNPYVTNAPNAANRGLVEYNPEPLAAT